MTYDDETHNEDQGYFMAYSPCHCCKQIFGYNPLAVPSVRIHGIRQPICRECMEKGNALRRSKGIEEIAIRPDAYEPIPECMMIGL